MTIWTTALIVAWSLIASSACCFGQEAAEEFVAKAHMQAAIPAPSEKEEAEAAGERAMNNPTLQHGGIIATGQGFVVSLGGRKGISPKDFLPTPDLRHQPP
jgi:hypothetical protein